MLKDEGTLHCSVPNIYWLGRIIRILLNKRLVQTYTFHEHINSWTIFEIENLLTRNNFNMRETSYGERVSEPYKRFRLIFKILFLNKILKPLTNYQLFFSAKKSVNV